MKIKRYEVITRLRIHLEKVFKKAIINGLKQTPPTEYVIHPLKSTSENKQQDHSVYFVDFYDIFRGIQLATCYTAYRLFL